MKIQKAFSLVLLLIEVGVTLFVAGIIAPSLLRSAFATNMVMAVGGLHKIKIGGLAFSYTVQNIEFAILGGLAGTIAAISIHFPANTPKNTTPKITLRTMALR